MSSTSAARTTGPARRTPAGATPTAARARSRLRVLAPPPQAPSRLPVVLACAAVMLATLLTVLLLHIQLSRGSYAAHDLVAERTRLAEQEQALREELEAVSAPGALAERAETLGMVPGGEPGFLRLSDGSVTGDPEPAQAPAPPTPPPTAGEPAGEEPAGEEPAGEEPAGEEPAGEEPATADGAAPEDDAATR